MALENRIKIICSVETIRFYKNEFGIAVVSVDKVKEGKPKTDKFNQIIIKGTMPQLVEGNPYILVADYVEDPKWGGQYNIISIYSAITFGEDDIVGQKKFLSTLFTPLQIENMYAVLDNPFESLKNNRAEDLAHDEKYREKYDIVVSRAVSNMTTLVEYMLPFLKKGGK